MKIKRFAAVLLLLLPVQSVLAAGFSSLDTALSPLLEGRSTVNMAVSLKVKTLIPFDETRLDLINRVLAHAALTAQVEEAEQDQTTAFQLALGGETLLELSEQYRDGAYLLQTDLLPNRMLFSTQASPMDALLAASQEETAETDSALNTSDVEEAFDFLAAIDELEDCYRALLDRTVPLTEKNTPNYNIENIGKGRISYVAKLTTEQSGEMLAEIRAVLSCGMDAEYREELSQVTFAGGFVVALYQNADGEDICLYIKGTAIYPDGDRRTLKWQWGFTPDRKTQTFTYEAARENGTRDSRVIDAIIKRKQNDSSFTLSIKTISNLRRSTENETSTYTVDLKGNLGDTSTCKGSMARATKGTSGGESTDETQTEIGVDLSLIQSAAGAELAGTAQYTDTKNGTVQTELELTFAQASPAPSAGNTSDAANTANTADTAGTEAAAQTAPSVVIAIIPADPAAAQQSAQTPIVTAEETQDEQPEFLVGTAPLGLYDYEIPAEMTTISMDSTEQKVHQSLLNEAAQRLAGRLVRTMLNLPAEDKALLSDGMTEEDYAVFLAMLE